MPPLPVISGMEARAVFEHFGWRFARRKSSHMMLVKAGMRVNLSVPDHRQLDTGTLRSLIRDAGLSVDDFVLALRTI
jgi:predicted RNA binding protein YcfA (HicA-like mRNA interferase family)